MEAPLPRLLARAARESGHAAKRFEKKKYLTLKDEIWSFRYRTKMQNTTLKRQVAEAKQTVREDWATGSRLLPRRDVGKNKLTYGTVTSDVVYSPAVPEQLRKEPWLAQGDRVVLLSGRDQGKIGVVDLVSEEDQTVRVEGMNEVRYVVPSFVAEQQGRPDMPAVPGARALPWDQVKLVHAMADESGRFRDVIVDEVKLQGDWRMKSKTHKPRRFITGLNVEVPWPTETKEVEEDQDSDTLRMTVDERTFEPVLNELPMPASVIDELRGKYSKFRTRHEPEYIAMKEKQVALAQAKAAKAKDMGLTPFQKMAKEHRERVKEAPRLTEEQLAAIGENMVREKPELAQKL